MKGQLQKRTDASALACWTCTYFRDEDPDIFYCELQQEQFPGLCGSYHQGSKLADARTEWIVPDDL